jgi:hypothetical protein
MIADGAARRFAGVWSTHRPQPTTPSFGVGLWNLAFGRTARVETYANVGSNRETGLRRAHSLIRSTSSKSSVITSFE